VSFIALLSFFNSPEKFAPAKAGCDGPPEHKPCPVTQSPVSTNPEHLSYLAAAITQACELVAGEAARISDLTREQVENDERLAVVEAAMVSSLNVLNAHAALLRNQN